MSIDTSAAKVMLRGVQDVLSFPDVAIRINQMVQSQVYSAGRIAKEIETAPDIAAGILRLANCAIYAFPKRIESIHRAITLIGNQAVRDIVLAISAKSTLGVIHSGKLDVNHFWRHSVYCAAIARELAQREGGLDKDSLFTAGLLHDIGRLVLFRQAPHIALEVQVQRQESPGIQAHEVVVSKLGFHHGTLGGLLAERWQFPEKLVACISYHHQPFQAPSEHHQEVRLVHLANTLSQMLEVPGLEFQDLVFPFPGVLSDQALNEAAVIEIVQRVAGTIRELRVAFDIAA
ncbi:MAG: HDOD domain-containing protein [Pseudomonadota bacterium]